MNKILFVLKLRQTTQSGGISSGLYNSARMVADMLRAQGVDVNLVQVEDNNSIDREVTLHRPDIVIVEAFWVVPQKFDTLKRLHPKVKWVVRNHSQIPFLANEGVAVEWTRGYLERGVIVAPNSVAMFEDLRVIANTFGLPSKHAAYLPNYYPVSPRPWYKRQLGKCPPAEVVDIGCFGAIRPLKNQLQQAIGALRFAQDLGLELRFHINGNRIEQGNSELKNIRALFDGQEGYELIEHPWMPHYEFLKLVGAMDINLAVSLSESFCIVAADSVAMGVPTVGSHEIRWLVPESQVDATSSESIAAGIAQAYWGSRIGRLQHSNLNSLAKQSEHAQRAWMAFVKSQS